MDFIVFSSVHSARACPCCLASHSESGGWKTAAGRAPGASAAMQMPLLPSSSDCRSGPKCWTPCCRFLARCCCTREEYKQLLAYSIGEERGGGGKEGRGTKTTQTKNNHTESFYLVKRQAVRRLACLPCNCLFCYCKMYRNQKR